MYCLFCDVLCIVCVCICVLNYCHRVATQLQLNVSYHIEYLGTNLNRNYRPCRFQSLLLFTSLILLVLRVRNNGDA
jgi:hypothetical protein